MTRHAEVPRSLACATPSGGLVGRAGTDLARAHATGRPGAWRGLCHLRRMLRAMERQASRAKRVLVADNHARVRSALLLMEGDQPGVDGVSCSVAALPGRVEVAA